MMGQMDKSPIPAYAVTCWADDTSIYVALPMTSGGIPYITKFPLNEGGLARAVEILRKRPRESLSPTAATPANYALPQHQPMVRLSTAQQRLHAETTPEQRENARRLLAKIGIK